jgi:hypothetical protein
VSTSHEFQRDHEDTTELKFGFSERRTLAKEDSMIISSPNLSRSGEAQLLTPALVRGLYLIWRSELQRGNFAEIRELDREGSVSSFAHGASAHDPVFARNQMR